MTLVGQIPSGEFAGSWAHVADLAAPSIEELSAAESDLVRRAVKQYRAVCLKDRQGRLVYRYESALGEGE